MAFLCGVMRGKLGTHFTPVLQSVPIDRGVLEEKSGGSIVVGLPPEIELHSLAGSRECQWAVFHLCAAVLEEESCWNEILRPTAPPRAVVYRVSGRG